jgi:hypothetical protein
MEMSDHSHAPAALLSGKYTRYTINRRLIGPTAGLHVWKKEECFAFAEIRTLILRLLQLKPSRRTANTLPTPHLCLVVA